jgi:hypothetical protein
VRADPRRAVPADEGQEFLSLLGVGGRQHGAVVAEPFDAAIRVQALALLVPAGRIGAAKRYSVSSAS